MSQPFVYFTLFLIAGILTGSFLPVRDPSLIFVLFFFSFIPPLVLRKSLWKESFIGLIFYFFGILLIHFHLYQFPADHVSKLLRADSTQTEFRGVLTDEPFLKRWKARTGRKMFKVEAPVRITEIKYEGEWKPASGNVDLTFLFNTQALSWKIGESLEGEARFQRYPDNSFGKYKRRMKIYYQEMVSSPAKIRPTGLSGGYWFKRKLTESRHYLESKLLYGLDKTFERQILAGLVFGTRTEFSPDLKSLLLQTNTFHIMAISGFNMALVILILTSLLKALGLPPRGIAFLMCGVILFYIALVGWPPSATRAGLMSMVFLLGWGLNREVLALNTVAISAFLILVLSPQQLFMPGFQLSYMVVLGLMFWGTPLYLKLSRWPFFRVKGLKPVLMAFSASVIAWLCVLPIILCFFGSFTLYSVLTNMVIAGIVSLLTGLGLTALLINLFSVNMGIYFNEVNSILIESLMVILRFFHRLPGCYWEFPQLSKWWLVAYYFIMFFFLIKYIKSGHETIS